MVLSAGLPLRRRCRGSGLGWSRYRQRLLLLLERPQHLFFGGKGLSRELAPVAVVASALPVVVTPVGVQAATVAQGIAYKGKNKGSQEDREETDSAHHGLQKNSDGVPDPNGSVLIAPEPSATSRTRCQDLMREDD